MIARKALFALAAAVAVLVATAGVASAHSQLVATDPPSGAVLDSSPSVITLTFNEGVEISLGGIRLFASDGGRIVTSEPHHPDGASSKIAVDVSGRLAPGSYVVAWRAISADSHPVQGAFTFRVGGSGADDAAAQQVAARELARSGGSHPIGILFGIDRFVGFAALALVVGGLFFVAFIDPHTVHAPRVRVVILSALLAGVVAAAAGIGLQGSYAAGYGFGKFLSWSVWSAVLHTRFGQAALVRVIAYAVLVAGCVVLARRPSALATRALSVGALVALPLTVSAAGHASAGSRVPLALTMDTLHVAAMGVWLGGLVALIASTPPAASVQRFSSVALIAVGVIVASGLVQSWRQTGELDAFTSTTYGKLLITKLAIVVVIIGVARASRRLAWRGELPTLWRAVAGEVVLAAGVLAVTAVLVNTVPAKADLAKPFDKTVQMAPDRFVQVVIDPARSGANTLHLYFSDTTPQAPDVAEAGVRMSLPAAQVGPLDVPLVRAGPSHFVAQSFDLPLKGTWSLEVRVRVGDFDSYTATASVNVR